jgi:hypothetical protein
MGKRRVLVAVAGAAVLVGTATTVIGAQPTSPRQAVGCQQPYQPWFSAKTYPEPADVPELGPSIGIDTSKPDTDGDGTPDTIVDAGSGGTYEHLTITRGDGVVEITPGTHDYVYLNGYGPPPGDLDGDGRDELIIGVDQQGEQYILPGTTAPGTHAIDEAGISTGGRTQGNDPVGDQDGDGGDDVIYRTASGFEVLSGAELMAPGPGGTVGALSPIATYDGTDVTAAVLASGEAPTIITGARVGDETTVTVHSDPPVELTASGMYAEYGGGGVGTITVHRRDGATLVAVTASDRSGSSIAIWNLTDPCSRYMAPNPGLETTSTTKATGGGAAQPATPVAGTAGYTG